MKEYEITYLIDPSLDDEKRDEVNAAVDTALTKAKGAIVDHTEPNRRRLAYPIQKQQVGFARTVQVQLPAEKVEATRQTLRKQNGVLRVSILQTAAREEVTPEIFEAAAAKQQTTPKKALKTTEETETPKKKTAPAKEVSMEEVEEKIEEALEEEVK